MVQKNNTLLSLGRLGSTGERVWSSQRRDSIARFAIFEIINH